MTKKFNIDVATKSHYIIVKRITVSQSYAELC